MSKKVFGLAALALSMCVFAACGHTSHKNAAAGLHIDCAAAPNGDGSLAKPWNTLAKASSVRLRPGTKLVFRRGTHCSGTLTLRGSGTATRPAKVGAYGTGPLPRIDGTGIDAVSLVDTSHVIVENLEITNRGHSDSVRRGVRAVATRGVVRGVVLRRLFVHDVDGDLTKGPKGSAGIQISALGDTPTRFDGVTIADNRLQDVSRSGIRVDGTKDKTRPRASQRWPEASTRIVIRGNHLTRLGGDGIVPTGTDGALVEDNVVSDGNLRGRALTDPRGIMCNAGIWTFNANNTVIQRNEVFGMHFNGCDGTGYDIDYNQDGTIVQYNYSHDNEGGFILLCTDAKPRSAEVRFNLSVDDAFLIAQSPCSFEPKSTFAGLRVSNNTFVAPDPSLAILGARKTALMDRQNLVFTNNIVVATTRQDAPLDCGKRCSHNLFFGLPSSGVAALQRNPRFVDPGRRGQGREQVGSGFRLRAGSPAIGAGIRMTDSPSIDFFGARVTDPPSIGFDQAG